MSVLKMNVYDFDKTIYAKDSTVEFYLYCLRRHPRILLCAPRQMWGILLHALDRIDTTTMKSYFFTFLQKLRNTEDLVLSFWKQNERYIQPWYLEKKAQGDVIISASPSFLLEPICAQLGIATVIATNVSVSTGKISGKNCKGQEKVCRFRDIYPDATIDEFYSDSLSDTPLASIAEHAFLVKKGKLFNFPEKD